MRSPNLRQEECDMSRIIVGLSGGVDSAVAAYLLKLAGHDVIGITLKTWISETGEYSRCCEIDKARELADNMGIPYYVINCTAEFRQHITEPFAESYLRGETPNPCVICNRRIKWDKMLEAADSLGAEFIATGHYANIEKLPNGRLTVSQSLHAEKDQSYMLYRLSQEQLSRTLFPLGRLTKTEVRRIAKQAGLTSAESPDSQEVCFVTEGNYSDFIEEQVSCELPPEGVFTDENGNILGRHKGIYHYTVGQRKGLGVALGYRAFVKRIDAENHRVILGDERSLYSSVIECRDTVFMGMSEMKKNETVDAFVRIRYHGAIQKATVTAIGDGKLKITFDEPVRAAAPGQSAVIYDGKMCVLAGGMICNVLS